MSTYKNIKYTIPTEVVEHTDSINAFSDVDTTTTGPIDGQVLLWNATNSKWYPGGQGDASVSSGTQKAIFGFGYTNTSTNITNLMSSLGVVASDTTGVGTARTQLAASGFGGDKAIFGFGREGGTNGDLSNKTNLVSNAGVVASDTTGVGTARYGLEAARYGEDKAIFAFGKASSNDTSISNLVSNTGVVASDTTGVGTARRNLAAAGFGGDKAIFALVKVDLQLMKMYLIKFLILGLWPLILQELGQLDMV